MTAFTQHKSKLRHAVRVTASALAAFGVNSIVQLPQGYWIAFTAILVVQTSVGGSVKAVFERMLGTFAGAAWGAVVCTVASHFDHSYYWVAVIAGIAPASFLAALYPSFRIAPITVAIMLFGDMGLIHLTPLQYAEHRVAEIGLGCIIGMVVSLTVLPSRAHRMLAGAAAKALNAYADLLEKLMGSRPDEQTLLAQHAELRATITKLETVGEDATRERKSMLTSGVDPDALLRMMRRIRFDLVMVDRTLSQPLPPAAAAGMAAPLADIAAQSASHLRGVALRLTRKPADLQPDMLNAAFQSFGTALSELHRSHHLAVLNETELGRVFTLNFTLEQLHKNLHDLYARATEFAAEEGK
ncbi:MAG: FUSC family protein [Alphaproteobacteria bacterium]